MNDKIIYTSDAGVKFTENDIFQYIDEYLNMQGAYIFKMVDRTEYRLKLYDYVMSLLTGEHPVTILDQLGLSDDEFNNLENCINSQLKEVLPKVVITVRNGCAFIKECPKDIKVEIIDYDMMEV